MAYRSTNPHYRLLDCLHSHSSLYSVLLLVQFLTSNQGLPTGRAIPSPLRTPAPRPHNICRLSSHRRGEASGSASWHQPLAASKEQRVPVSCFGYVHPHGMDVLTGCRFVRQARSGKLGSEAFVDVSTRSSGTGWFGYTGGERGLREGHGEDELAPIADRNRPSGAEDSWVVRSWWRQ